MSKTELGDGKMNTKSKKYKKGVTFSIRTVGMIALGIMVVVLMYLSFETFTSSILEEFFSNLEFPSP
jgi:ABC-type phosphate transport system permease subunit